MKQMQKTCIATCVLLLLLFFAAISMLDVKSALALNVSVQWGHLSPAGDAIQGEHDAENWICNEVYQDFVAAGGNWGYSNAYWTYTTLGSVYQVFQWETANSVNFATNWWVGDFWLGAGPGPFGHLALYGHNGQHIYDNYTWIYANCYPVYYPYPHWVYVGSRQYFDFIWVCSNGGLYWKDSSGHWNEIVGITKPDTRPGPPNPPPGYPPTNTNTEYGFYNNGNYFDAVGMPLAFTGTTGMNTNGYWYPGGSYCYVGWEAMSPYMVNPTGYNGMCYKWFPYYFYRYALGLVDGTHHTIRDSLDYATRNIFGEGTYFGNSLLYYGNWTWCPYAGMVGWWYASMKVFGNSNMALPY